MRIVAGEKSGDIKTPPSDVQPPKYDWRELQRWKISESLLPPSARIEFRQPTSWESYRWQIGLICSIVAAQAILILLLLHERRQRFVAEVDARQRIAELAHVNRYSMAGELTTSITHEINQPLASIRANTEAAQMIFDQATPDMLEIREIIGDIARDQHRASDVITHLRSLLKKAPFELRDIDLNDVVDETLKFLAALAVGRQVEVSKALHAGSLPIRGDRVQLQQVFLNLIVNAMDAMSGMPIAARRISVTTIRHGDLAVVAISDAGPGVPADKLAEIFEPFFTTKAQGMGMGLSIARTIVEAHGGRLGVEDQANGGARFTVSLPVV